MAATSIPSDIAARFVMLVYGRMQDGKSPYWCYVAVKPQEYQRFQQTLQSGKLDLHRFEEQGYGEIAVSGPGLYPPQDITREVARAYGVPLKDLFSNADPETLMARKIAKLKEESGSAAQ